MMSYARPGEVTADWIPLGSRAIPKDIENKFNYARKESGNSSRYHTATSVNALCTVCKISYGIWPQHCPGVGFHWKTPSGRTITEWLKAGQIDFVDGHWLLDPTWIKRVNLMQANANINTSINTINTDAVDYSFSRPPEPDLAQWLKDANSRVPVPRITRR